MKFWPMRTAEPTTKPGLFCGWRLDAGLRYRDILQVLGYEAVRTRAHLHWLPKGVHENGDPLCPRLSILSSLLGHEFMVLHRVAELLNTELLFPRWFPLPWPFYPPFGGKTWPLKGSLNHPKRITSRLARSGFFFPHSCFAGGIFLWNVFRIRIGLHSSIVDQESGHEARLFGLVGTFGHHLSRKQKIHCGCLGFRGWQSIQL